MWTPLALLTLAVNMIHTFANTIKRGRGRGRAAGRAGRSRGRGRGRSKPVPEEEGFKAFTGAGEACWQCCWCQVLLSATDTAGW